uniref:NADH-ubiquinone oxidoreductase chain 4 n=1 Tax=Anterhynchium (Dirhynchium) sp. QHZ-2020 TaxID=2742733 RepID=A0A6M9AWN9_9HYME|nr:NADH dehydrogenase subunit 4 [Anterhynchium (Dirhynchium) sp. QHZ-2020]
MKFLMFLMFSFGLSYFCLYNMYMICFFILVGMILNVNIMMKMWVVIYSIFSIDFYSLYLILLSLWIIGIMMLISMTNMSLILILFLLLILMLSFSTFNMLMFYFMFEVSLLPIFMLILFDGYSFERFEAALYMFFFTLVSSMPFLIMILDMIQYLNTLMFFMLSFLEYKMWVINFIFMMLVFFVKMPIFVVHIWLPKAHVEAPVYGSMILAGVLLKLGSYGILRMVQFFYFNINVLMYYFISFGLISGVILSLICLVQIDMKMLVAYSSVVHMSLVFSSLMTMSSVGFIGSYLMMIGHGLCSSGMFYIVYVSYSRVSSRLMYINKGFLNMDSSLSMWWFLLCIGNFSAPITLSLIGEIFMLMSLISLDYFLMLYLMMMCFLSASYSLYLFSFTQHGSLNYISYNFIKINVKEYFILFIHWFPLNFLTFGLNLFMI